MEKPKWEKTILDEFLYYRDTLIDLETSKDVLKTLLLINTLFEIASQSSKVFFEEIKSKFRAPHIKEFAFKVSEFDSIELEQTYIEVLTGVLGYSQEEIQEIVFGEEG